MNFYGDNGNSAMGAWAGSWFGWLFDGIPKRRVDIKKLGRDVEERKRRIVEEKGVLVLGRVSTR